MDNLRALMRDPAGELRRTAAKGKKIEQAPEPQPEAPKDDKEARLRASEARRFGRPVRRGGERLPTAAEVEADNAARAAQAERDAAEARRAAAHESTPLTADQRGQMAARSEGLRRGVDRRRRDGLHHDADALDDTSRAFDRRRGAA